MMKQPADLDPYNYDWTPAPSPMPNQNIADSLHGFTHIFMIMATIVVILFAINMAHSFYIKEKERNATNRNRNPGNQKKANPR